jgi:hypothetical protein
MVYTGAIIINSYTINPAVDNYIREALEHVMKIEAMDGYPRSLRVKISNEDTNIE